MRYLVLLSILFLVGCASAPIAHKSVLISPPQAFTEDCTVEPPPEKEAYISASMKDREKMLYDMNMKQLKNIKTCNERMKHLRDWRTQQEALYEETTK